MKNRYQAYSKYTLLTTRSGTSVTYNESFPLTWYDQLQVNADYTGPKNPNPDVCHPHNFLKTLTQDYIGSKVSTLNGGLSSTQLDGRIMTFSRTPYPGFGGVPSLSSSALYSEALSKLYDQVRGDVDWAVNVAEFHQTSKLVKEYRDHLIPLAEKLEKDAGRLIRFVRRFHPKQWGRRWLEYQYGVKPLVSDMYSTMKQMLDFTSNHTVRVKARSKREDYGSKTYDLGSSGRETVKWSLSERCEVRAVFTIPASRLASLANYMSLNPASLAWELTTASFVVDWVLNVGGFLRNLESAILFAGYATGSYTTYTWRLTGSGTLNCAYSFGLESSFGGGSASIVASGKNRQVVDLFPPAPVVDVKLGSSRLFSAASLLSLFVTKGTGPK